MPKVNLVRVAQALRSEKARLEGERARLTDRGGTTASAGSELTDYDVNHPADLGSELFEREKDIALAENVSVLLGQVNAALAKIAAGSYGVCDHCGKAITDARLRALPAATLCVGCQSRSER